VHIEKKLSDQRNIYYVNFRRELRGADWARGPAESYKMLKVCFKTLRTSVLILAQ